MLVIHTYVHSHNDGILPKLYRNKEFRSTDVHKCAGGSGWMNEYESMMMIHIHKVQVKVFYCFHDVGNNLKMSNHEPTKLYLPCSFPFFFLSFLPLMIVIVIAFYKIFSASV